MKKLRIMSLILLGICLVPVSVLAADFDGSKPLVFWVIHVIECAPEGSCQEVTAEDVNLAEQLLIDVKKRRITAVNVKEDKRESKIERIERVDGKLMLQGAEDGIESVRDGFGWTVAISEETGHAVLTASGDKIAFVVFGVCVPHE